MHLHDLVYFRITKATANPRALRSALTQDSPTHSLEYNGAVHVHVRPGGHLLGVAGVFGCPHCARDTNIRPQQAQAPHQWSRPSPRLPQRGASVAQFVAGSCMRTVLVVACSELFICC